jgi:hypothetical protein
MVQRGMRGGGGSSAGVGCEGSEALVISARELTSKKVEMDHIPHMISRGDTEGSVPIEGYGSSNPLGFIDNTKVRMKNVINDKRERK